MPTSPGCQAPQVVLRDTSFSPLLPICLCITASLSLTQFLLGIGDYSEHTHTYSHMAIISPFYMTLILIFVCPGYLLLGGLFSSWGRMASHWGNRSCCAARAPEHRLSSYGTWYLLRSGMESVSPELVGGFFTIKPPGKPMANVFNSKHVINLQVEPVL